MSVKQSQTDTLKYVKYLALAIITPPLKCAEADFALFQRHPVIKKLDKEFVRVLHRQVRYEDSQIQHGFLILMIWFN